MSNVDDPCMCGHPRFNHYGSTQKPCIGDFCACDGFTLKHDPLCPFQPSRIEHMPVGSRIPAQEIPAIPCQCALILEVRTDERREADARWVEVLSHD